VAKRNNIALTLFLLLTLSAFIFSFTYKFLHPLDFSKIKIEVLNGCGVDDLARDTSRYLRRKGFDVTYFGNAAEHQKKTVIVDKLAPDEKWGRMVGRALGIKSISTSVDSTRLVHIVILLGMDYDQVLPKEILNRRLIGTQQ